MRLPIANKHVVERRIAAAKHKIERFKDKIERIEQHLVVLAEEKTAAETTLEYFSLTGDRRALLLDLFVFEGEYGETEALEEWHLQQLSQYAQSLAHSIGHYQRCMDRRRKGVAFLEKDIERLNIIGAATYQRPYLVHGVLDV